MGVRALLAFWCPVLGILVSTLGVGVLLGWKFGFEPVTRLATNLAYMAPSTALGFIMTGTALALHVRLQPKTNFRHIQLCSCFLTCLMAAFAIAGNALGVNLQIDSLFSSHIADGTIDARMSLMTAACFILIGSAIAFLTADAQRLNIVAGALGFTSLLIALFAILGYTFDTQALYMLKPFESMALHTAVSFVALSLGVIGIVIVANWHFFQDLDKNLLQMGLRIWLLFVLFELTTEIFLIGSIEQRSGQLLAVAGAKTLFVFIISAAFILAAIGFISISNTKRQKLQNRIENILNSTAEGIYGVDVKGVCNFANQSCIDMLGYETTDELIGKTIHNVIHHHHPDGSPHHIKDCPVFESLVTQKRVHIEDDVFWKKDGTSIPVEYWSYPVVRNKTVIGSVITFFNIAEKKQAEETRELLLAEVNHRAKNLLSVVQSIAKQTARSTKKEEFASALVQRLHSLSASQDLIIQGDWIAVSVSELAKKQLSHLGELALARCAMDGPQIRLQPQAAQGIGMAFHELATNSMKYGALSNNQGTVHIEWSLFKDNGADMVEIVWREKNGPPVTKPTRRGFGSMVIEKMAAASVRGEVSLDYASDGITWQLKAPTKYAMIANANSNVKAQVAKTLARNS